MEDRAAPQTRPILAYLLTDVAGSTRLWETRSVEMARSISRLENLVNSEVASAGGRVIKSRGEGDSHFCVFGSVEGALEAGTRILLGMKGDDEAMPLELRAGIHAGSSESWDGDYYGPIINRCARIRQAAHPSQILVSEVVKLLAQNSSEIQFKDLGVHRLKDLMQPERLFQVLHPGLPSELPPPKSLSSLPHNLPSYLDSFIGRQEDVRALCEALRTDRLITITGAGGVGKTRLALQVAAERVQDFEDGAWFVDLAQTERSESVLPIVCTAIAPGIEATLARLVEAIASQRALLILDNCEHLYEECRALARQLLQKCPGLTALATSRGMLDIAGEHVYKLTGLPVPEPDQMGQALEYEAVRLFVERTMRRGTDITLSDSTLSSIVELCRKLDGLPLAIEIAATMTDVHSIQDIASSLRDCLRTEIRVGSEDERHRTMLATIEWSRRLLSRDAQTLLQRFTIFPGTWSLAATEAVCATTPAGRAAIRDQLRELVNHNLVFASRTQKDEVRFGLLQTTREVLRAKREPAGLRKRFVKYCRHIVEEASAFTERGEEPTARELLDLEWETLIKGLELSYEDSPNDCAETALALKNFWAQGTRITEGKAWMERIAFADGIESAKRISAQLSLSSFCIWLGEYDRADALLQTTEVMLSDTPGYELAKVFGNRSVLRQRAGRPAEAKAELEKCWPLFQEFGTPIDTANALLNLGVVKLLLQEPSDEIADLFGKALEYARAAGSPSMQATAYSCLASVDLQAGRYAAALDRYAAALELWSEGPFLADSASWMVDLTEILSAIGKDDGSLKVMFIAERLEEITRSPLDVGLKARLRCAHEVLKEKIPASEWRSAQRLTRAKSAAELISMAARTVQEARSTQL